VVVVDHQVVDTAVVEVEDHQAVEEDNYFSFL
jgi:hypothetical protein